MLFAIFGLNIWNGRTVSPVFMLAEMPSGSAAAGQVSNIVLLRSDFSVMPSVVAEGRRVINNIQRSASLFLVKNIFSFLFAIITLFIAFPYPLLSNQMSIISGLTIGIPSFVLAMEPNRERLSGRFLPKVIYRAFPAAMTDLVLVLGMLFFYEAVGLAGDAVRSVATGLMGVVGILMVDRCSRPYTTIRKILMIFISVAFVAAFLFFKPWVNLPPMAKGDWAILIVFALLAKPVMDLWSRGLDAPRHKVEKVRGEWDI